MTHTPSSHPSDSHEASGSGGGKPDKKSLSAAMRLLVAALAGAGVTGAAQTAHADEAAYQKCVSNVDHSTRLPVAAKATAKKACEALRGGPAAGTGKGGGKGGASKKSKKSGAPLAPGSGNPPPVAPTGPTAPSGFETMLCPPEMAQEAAKTYGIDASKVKTFGDLFKAITEVLKNDSTSVPDFMRAILADRYGEKTDAIKTWGDVKKFEKAYLERFGWGWKLNGLAVLAVLLIGGAAFGGRAFARKRLENDPKAVSELLGGVAMDNLVVGHVKSLGDDDRDALIDRL